MALHSAAPTSTTSGRATASDRPPLPSEGWEVQWPTSNSNPNSRRQPLAAGEVCVAFHAWRLGGEVHVLTLANAGQYGLPSKGALAWILL